MGEFEEDTVWFLGGGLDGLEFWDDDVEGGEDRLMFSGSLLEGGEVLGMSLLEGDQTGGGDDELFLEVSDFSDVPSDSSLEVEDSGDGISDDSGELLDVSSVLEDHLLAFG